jgi:hypothetical protein
MERRGVGGGLNGAVEELDWGEAITDREGCGSRRTLG